MYWKGAQKSVLCLEIVLFLEGPLSEGSTVYHLSFFYSFQSYAQTVSLSASEQKWPPKKENSDTTSSPPVKRDHFEFNLSCGESEGVFEFQLFKYVDPSSQPQQERPPEVEIGSAEPMPDKNTSTGHQVVDIPAV